MPDPQNFDELQGLFKTNPIELAPDVQDIVNAPPPQVQPLQTVDELQQVFQPSSTPSQPAVVEEPSFAEVQKAKAEQGSLQMLQFGTVVPLLARELVRKKLETISSPEAVAKDFAGKAVELAEIVSKPARLSARALPGESPLKKIDDFFEQHNKQRAEERFRNIATDPASAEALTKVQVMQDLIQSLEPEGIEPLSFKGITGAVTQAMIGNILPAIGVGLVAGPKAGLTFFGSQAFINQFAESTVERNRSLEQSLADGYFAAIAEAIPEIYVLRQILKPGQKILERVFKGALAEGAQEIVTELLNMGRELGEFGDDITVKEALTRLIQSGTVGAFIGGKLAGAFHIANAAAKKRKATTEAPFNTSQSKLIDADKIDPGGPNMTRGEKSRLSFVQEHLSLLKLIPNTPEVQTTIELFEIELADLQDKTLTEIDETGQVLITGVSIADVNKSRTLTEPGNPELLTAVERPETEVAPLNINSNVDQAGLQQRIEDLSQVEVAQQNARLNAIHAEEERREREAEESPKFSIAKTLTEQDKEAIDPRTPLQRQQQDAQAEWSMSADPKAMIEMAEAYGADVEYQAELRGILDGFFPDSDTIIMFNGHRPGRGAFTEQEKTKRVVGNASIDPAVAMMFGYAKVRQQISRQKAGKPEVEGENFKIDDALVTIIEIPKAAIKAVNTRLNNELEFIFETETTSHRGHFKFLDYVNGLSQPNVEDPSFSLEDIQLGKVGTLESMRVFKAPDVLNQKLPIERTTAEGQIELAGLGTQQIAPVDIAPDQLDFLGTLDESLAPEQQNLGLAPAPTINLDTGAFEEIPGTEAGTRGGTVWQHEKSGTKFFVKMVGELEAHNEVLTSQLYKLAGVNVPKTYMAVHDGKIGVASRVSDQAEQLGKTNAVELPGLVDNFVIDAWLGNRDVIGLEFDNIMVEETPLGARVLRLDFGGALTFRAGGKTKEFIEKVSEVTTMRDKKAAHRPAVQVFGGLSDADVARQATRLQDISDSDIFQVVQRYGMNNPSERAELSRILIARRNDIVTRFPPPVGFQVKEQPGPAAGSMDRVRQMAVGQKAIAKAQAGGILLDNARGIRRSDTSVQARKRALLEQDKYNWWVNLTWTIQQMAKKNRHIKPLVSYNEEQSAMANTKMQWIARAEQRVRQWQGLYKGQADALANLLFDVNEMTYLKKKEKPRQPTTEELAALVDKHKLDTEAIEMYFLIRQDFQDVLLAVEEAEIEAARKTFADETILNEKIIEIKAGNKKLRQRPYFPLSRFGEHTIVVKDDDQGGKIIYMESFEGVLGKVKRERRLPEVIKMFPGKNIRKDIIVDSLIPFRSLPPSVKEDIIKLLELDKPLEGAENAQKETERIKKLRGLEQIIFEQDNVQSFKKHFEKRKGTPGYSKDALRNYADYFFRGANHIARVKHVNALDAAIQAMDAEIKVLKDIPGSPIIKRRQIGAWMKDHREYILNPENDLANLRALGFVWFLGFVPKSALVNLTQVPLIAAPYLSDRYSEVAATTELGRAIKDLRRIYKNDPSGRVTEQKLKGINLGIQMGFLEESQAMELAAMSTSSVLQRALPGNKIQRTMREVQYASAWMFQTAEKMNRRIVFSAAWELALKNPDTAYLKELVLDNPRLVERLRDSGWAQQDIVGFLAGKDAVDTTQYEYASWNRPKFMRGKQSVVFLFFQYLQNTLWFMNNAPGSGRALMLLLLAAGIAGMPGAEDIEEFIKWFGRQVDKDWNPERAFREYVTEVSDIDPDVFLHGASRFSFGLAHVGDMTGVPIPTVDLSGSLSLGQVVPGAQGFFQGGDFEHRFLRTSTDAGGAVVNGAMGIAQALADTQNVDAFKRWERAMPSQLRNMSKAYRRLREGGEFTRTGAKIADISPEDPEHMLELIFQAGGFSTTRISQEWDRIRIQQEAALFWEGRKRVLMSALDRAAIRDDDQGVSDTLAAIEKFNNEVPFDGLAISGQQLKTSRKTRRNIRERQEAGLLPQKKLQELSEETNVLFPNSTVNQEEQPEEDISTIQKLFKVPPDDVSVETLR